MLAKFKLGPKPRKTIIAKPIAKFLFHNLSTFEVFGLANLEVNIVLKRYSINP